MIVTLLVLTMGSAWADNLKAESVIMNAGTQKVMGISLEQTAEKYAGFQFDVELPAGITLVGESLDDKRTGDMTYTKRTQSDGSIRFIVYSPTLTTAHAGHVMEMQLKADKKAVAGSYSIKFRNMMLSDVNGNMTYLSDAVSPLTIVPPVKVTAFSRELEYGDDNGMLEYDVSENYTTGMPTIDCSATQTSPVGTYSIIVGKGSIVADTVTLVNGTLTVTKAPLMISGGTYSMKQGDPLPTFVATFAGFKNGETSAVLTKQPALTTTATSSSTPGTYEVTVSGAEAKNYDISYTAGTLTITAADPVTVTAKNYTRVYGEANPTFEFTSEGATLNGTPEITCEATVTSPVGTYPIVIKKGGVTNYNDSYVNGTLTITKAPLTISAGDYTMKQGDALPTFKATYSGFKNSETSAVLTKQPTLTTTATSASTPGTYEVTVSGAEAKNYDFIYKNGTLTILEADAVVVTAKSYTREYGEDNPTFEFTSEGATLEGQPEITCEATATSPAGTYPIVIKKGGVTNYNDSYVNGTLTITKAPLKVTVADATREQGVENPEFVITYEGWKNGETEAVLTKKPVATTTATKDSEVGEYDIIVSGGEAQNYELSYVNGKLTVTVPSGIREIISGGSFDVYTTDGRMVKKGATTLKGLAKGVYIVNGRKVMVK